jgi:hypothetical protein
VEIFLEKSQIIHSPMIFLNLNETKFGACIVVRVARACA